MTELEELRERVQQLERSVLAHDSYIKSFSLKLDPNPACQLTTRQDYIKFWSFLTELWAKKEWDIDTEIRPFYSSAWFLMDSGLRQLERIAHDRYAWLKIPKLLKRMHQWIETDPRHKNKLESRFISENLVAAEARIRYFMVSYLFEYAPEVYETILADLNRNEESINLPKNF
jgi:hypothetical protein